MKEINFDIVFDSQKIFRVLLDAFARPGKINKITDLKIKPPLNVSKAALEIFFTLLDLEVGFYVWCFDEQKRRKIEEYIVLNTGSNPRDLESADFVLALNDLSELKKVKKGGLEYPEQGATVVRVVEEIGENLEGNFLTLTLTGPGINGKKTVSLRGVKREEIIEIIEVNKDFPLGIDFLFVDKKDKILALPRSTKIVEVYPAFSTCQEIPSARKGGVKEA